jgi:hypothetical protein
MGERSVRRHLDALNRDGWVERIRVRRDKGHAWYRTEYAAVVPDGVYAHLPERPWEADPQWKRQPATVAGCKLERSARGTLRETSDNRPTAIEVPATQAEQPANAAGVPANHDTNNRPSFGRLTLPLNSSSNSPSNSSHECALPRTSRLTPRPKTTPEEIERRRKEAAEICAKLGIAKREGLP